MTQAAYGMAGVNFWRCIARRLIRIDLHLNRVVLILIQDADAPCRYGEHVETAGHRARQRNEAGAFSLGLTRIWAPHPASAAVLE